MRRCLAPALSLAFVFACGPVDTGAGSASAGAGADGGPIWTTGGGSADGGSGGSGVADGGSASDGGSGGGGSGGGAVSASCEGVVPSQNPAPHAATVPHGPGEVCYNFTSDGQGVVASESHSDNGADPHWRTFSPDGARLGDFFAGFDLQTQPAGWIGTQRASGATSLVHWSGAGAELRRTSLGGPGCSGESFISAAPGKGSLALGGCSGGRLTATLFDANGAAIVTRPVADAMASAVGIVDARGAVLVVVYPGSAIGSKADIVARWFDAQLAPVTDWFALPGNGRPYVRPLIGGGAAVKSNGAWTASVASGAAGVGPAPSWLASRPLHEYQIVRGGRAYALIPKNGAPARNQVDLLDPAGNLCGAGTFPGAEGLSVSVEGTVIGSGGDGGCDMTWWAGVLR